jgi:hypothetical protein
MRRVEFGVGCFHFGYHPPIGSKFTGSDYLSQVKGALAGIPNIEKIDVVAEDEFLSHEFEADHLIDELCDGFNFFPFPQSEVHIHLSLYLPERVQQELNSDSYSRRARCERFIVDIIYPYYFPITFVRAVNPPTDYGPSDGVFGCRRFFERCFDNREDTDICFEFLGPSPFHAEFFLEEKENEAVQLFECVREPSRGYDSYYFRYDGDYFEDAEDAYDSLIDHLDGQLGLFFLINHSRIQRDRDWADCYTLVQKIIEAQKKRGFKAYWRNTLRSEQALHDAMIQLAQIEASDLDTRYNVNRNLKELYTGDKSPELLPFLESAIDDLSAIPFEQMREILNLLESRRTKRLHLIMAALSAVMGGATGAWLTLLLKGGG